MLTPDLNMRAGLKVAVQYLAFCSLFANSANGFFPTIFRQSMAGNGGMSHEQLTHDMYDQLVVEYFPEIRIVSAGMTRARKTITKANIAVDADEAETAASHFDGETFVAGQERLQRLYQEVIDNLDNDDADAAQQALGGALHTLQDFYSHTNWIELGNRSPHPELGRKDKSISGIAGPGETTCNDCGPHNPLDSTASCQDCRNNTVGFTSLTSGFYFGEDVPDEGNEAIPLFKCHHGGYSDNIRGPVMGIILGPPTPGINKDSNSCGWSPHSTLHRPAAEVALAASIQLLNDLKKDLEEVKLKQLFGIGPTLALVVDTTGSMSDIISSVRAQCLAIIDEREGTADEPTSYILEPFNDPNIGPLTQTSDLEVFRSRINGLFASGGADCPEYAIGGMIAATEALDGGSLFMFTDAAAKDEGRMGELVSKATAKDIAIYIFKFDSGCDGASAKLKKRGDVASDRVYGDISRATGGQYRSLPRSDVGQIRGLVDTLSTANNRDVLKVQGSFTNTGTSGGSASFEVPVDSRMTRVTFSASGPSLRMTIRTPSGSTLDLSSESVTSTFLTDGQFIIVQNPAVGVWTVALRGPSSFNLDVTGSDPLSFSAFDVVETCGRNGHRGYCPISGPPASDHNVGAVATIDGGFSTAVFELRSLAGKVLRTLPMEPGSGEFGEPPTNSFFGVFQYPVGSFYVYATGNDIAGTTYQRLLPSLITPVVSGTNNTGLEDVFVTVNGTLPSSTSSTSSSSFTSSSSTSSRRQTPGVAPRPTTSSTMSMPITFDINTTSSSSSYPSSSFATRRITPGVAPGVAPRPSSRPSSVEAAADTPSVA